MRHFSLTFLSIFFFVSLSIAQRPALPSALYNTSIDSQFYYINSLSRSESGFKLIRPANLNVIKASVADTLKSLRAHIVDLETQTSTHSATKQNFQDSISTLSSQLQAEQQKTDSILFLGMSFSKSGYHTFVWSIIIVLALAFLITLASFRKAKSVSIEEKENSIQFQDELQAVRKKAIEKEQQLKRQLLDEQLKRNS